MRSTEHTRGSRLALAAALAVGTVLRAWNLPAQVMSDDEMHTIRAVLGTPVGEILSSYGRQDYSLPMAALYRGLLAGGVEPSEMLLRLLPLVAGVAALAVLPLGARRWLDGRAAGWFAWLLVVSVPLVYYSRVIRPYGWSLLLALVAVAAFARWWPEGRTRLLILYAAAGSLAVWFLPVVGPFVAAPLLWAAADALRHRDATRLRRLLLAAAALGAAVAALFAPALPELLAVVSRKAGRARTETLPWLEALQLHAGSGSAWVAAGVGVAAVAGFLRHLLRDRGAALYWALPVALQGLAVGLASPLGTDRPFILERYLLPTLPVLLGWAAYAFATPIRRPAPARARDLAGVALVVALLATGPFARPELRSSPFMHHKDYLELYAPLARMPPRAIPATYRTILPALPPGPVLEYPWVPVWHFTDALRIYQEAHGRDVVVVPAVSPALQDPRLAFRNMVPDMPEAFLASRARYLFLHLDYGAEEARVVEPEWRSARIRRGAAEELRVVAAARRQELGRLWGPPDWQDRKVQVWDLDRVRGTVDEAARLVGSASLADPIPTEDPP